MKAWTKPQCEAASESELRMADTMLAEAAQERGLTLEQARALWTKVTRIENELRARKASALLGRR